MSAVALGATVLGTAAGAGGAAVAATTTVDDDGGADYTSIQAAVNDSASGDTIEVRPGTYHEEVVVDRTLTLIAPDGATLDGSQVSVRASGILLPEGSSAAPTIDGFTIRNYVDCLSAERSTGAWTLENATLEGCEVQVRDSTGDWTVGNTTISSGDVRGSETEGAWTIRDTTITNSSFAAIQMLESAGDWTVSNTTVRDSSVAGVWVSRSTGAWTIRNSTVTRNDDGIRAYNASGGWEIQETTITDNRGTGLAARGPATNGDATRNWWGDPSGPDGTYEGAGDAVAGDIAVNPIYVDAARTTTRSNATRRTRSSPATIVVDGAGTGDTATIQTAIDRARPGDTVLVRDGTYQETVRVDLTVTVDGPNATLNPPPAGGIAGIQLPSFSRIAPTIRGLTITGFSVWGVDAINTDGAWRIENVTTSDMSTGVTTRSSGGDWVIDGLTSVDNERHGVEAGGSGDWTIRNSTVARNGRDGIDAERTFGDWTIVGTSITDSSGPGVRATGTFGAWEIHDSTLANNDGPGVVATDAATEGDATCNWWGASDGPGGDFPGSGDEAIGNVTVDPFYTDAARTAPSDGSGSSCSESSQLDVGVELEQEETVAGGGTVDISAFVNNRADQPLTGATVELLVDANADGQLTADEVVTARTADFAAGENREVVLTYEDVSLAAGEYVYAAQVRKDGQTTRSFTTGTLTVEAGDTGAVVESRFEEDAEGWTVVGDAQEESTTPDYEATGGNPGGHLSATDDAVGGIWYWNAPEKFLGDKAGAYDRTLSYDLRASATDEEDADDERDVILEGSGMTLFYDHGGPSTHPSNTWTPYEIPLNASADGWIVRETGEPPTRAEFESVLSDLSRLQLRGEFNSGSDTGRLDNVVLEVGSAADEGFAVSDVAGPGSVSTGTAFSFSGVITNTGDSQATVTVEGSYATATVASRTLTLDPGASRTVSFRTTSQSVAGTHTATISTADDQGTATVEVVGQEFVCAASTGDPHIASFGGASYDFMAFGDFVAAREPAGDLLVVARQVPVSDSVSINNATGTLVGGDRVVIDAEADTPVSVNGTPTPVEDGGSVAVGDGGEVRRRGNTYTVVYPGGDGQADASDERLTAHVRGNRVDIELCLHPGREGEVEGLFGDTDGESSDDIAFANGTALDRPLDPDQLYGDFRADWRATGEEAIINGIFYIEDFPRSIVTVEDLSDEERARAESVLEDTCLEPGTPQYRDALLDVALTGDESYVASACQVARDDLQDADTGGVSVTLQPADASVAPGDTITLDVVAEGTPDGQGVGSYNITINSSDTSRARIAAVSDGIGGVPRNSTAADGSGIRAGAFNGDTSDTGAVTIATVTVEGVAGASGDVDVPLSVASISNESGVQYGVGSAVGASLTVGQTCPDVTGDGNPATDPDGDGLCEDVNGDGSALPGDATVLFNAVFDNNPAVMDNVAQFDFSQDGTLAPGDATVLFDEIF